MAKLSYATNRDYERINDYFKESGVTFNKGNEIVVFEDKQKALIYLMNYDPYRFSYFLLNNASSDSDEAIGDFILDNLDDVWNDYENGKIYIIG